MRTAVIVASGPFDRDALGALAGRAGLTVVATTTTPAAIPSLLERLHPDLVLLSLPTDSAVLRALDLVREATDRRLAGDAASRRPWRGATRPVVLTRSARPRLVLPACRHGACGVLLLDQPSEQLATALTHIARGHVVIDPQLAAPLVEAATRGRRVRGPFGLSGQEMVILRHLTRRLSNSEIGREIGISGLTVKSHLRSAYRKLDVSNRREAVRFAVEHGLT